MDNLNFLFQFLLICFLDLQLPFASVDSTHLDGKYFLKIASVLSMYRLVFCH